MQKYYIEHQLVDSKFDNKDLAGILVIILLVLISTYLFCQKSKNINVKVIEPYYQERFYEVPSNEVRFENKQYDIAISKIMLDDSLRRLKNKFKDLNKSITSYNSDLQKHQAMNEIILMLNDVKKGKLDSFDIEKMQQSVLEAGYGNVDKTLLAKAVRDYQNKIEEENAIKHRILEEKRKTEQKIEQDSKEAVVLAKDIARDIAEDEIESFIENLAILARIGSFVIQKVSQ